MCWSEKLAVIQQAGYKAYRVDSRVECFQINKQVYSSICKGGHAAIVVCGGINVVYSNGIGAQSCHGSGIQLALCGIDERVSFGQLICNT